MNKITAFVGGAHGAGKGHFCSALAPRIKAEHYSASSLIRGRKDIGPAKAVDGIDNNQAILIEEFSKLQATTPRVILDGHFCLYNLRMEIEPIPAEVYRLLGINHILLLTAEPEIIYSRLQQRDGSNVSLSIQQVANLQEAEAQHAHKVGVSLGLTVLQLDVGGEGITSALNLAQQHLTQVGNA
ncbi:AAA family ATPase [Chitinolyticbacter meiyuanensis]|uniref:AAA family ATPase n=1 Tax=Chitinolyticbacter meiyuanensis TaxID=682798 RepID=UPI0011E5F83C|nr:AAA family ATPase [Chitinolyticbacter meiyuanensis]